MTTTTVLSEDTATIVAEDARRFSWSAAIAGAFVATAVTFFLATLGSGIGLALVSAPGTATKGFLTLGAIYFFAAQAFGFAAGGHLAGRLMGPAVENSREEEFRAGAHGLVVWALAVVASLGVVALTATIGGAAVAGGVAAAKAPPQSYWADVLLRASPSTPAATLANDKAEAARILAVDLTGDSDRNRQELARLVSYDVGLSHAAALDRVTAVENEMRADAVRAAETARKAASLIGIWTALALLFGGVVAVAAAISARWEDDRISFSMASRR